MWSSDSDLALLDMLSDWSDLSSDEDSDDSISHFVRNVNCTSGLNKNATEVRDDVSMYDEDDAPSLCRDSQSKGQEETLFNEYQCNVCNKTITDFRYTCVQCSDLDLCGACEARRAHHHHYVLRVPAPRPFAEVQFVLATIRRHLMKRLDPIMEPGQDRDDVISVKSEIKIEFENDDDFANTCEDENNGDDENSDDEITEDDGNNDDHDEDNDNNGNNDNNEDTNIVDVDMKNTTRKNTLNSSEASAQPESKPLDTRESRERSLKQESESKFLVKQLGACRATSNTTSTEASNAASTGASRAASTVAPQPAAASIADKRKILIKRANIINVKDFGSPAKIMRVEPITSRAVKNTGETVTLVFADDQPPQLQPPETGQEYLNESRRQANEIRSLQLLNRHKDYVQNYRLSEDLIHNLLNDIKHLIKAPLRRRRGLSMKVKLLCALAFCGSGSYQRICGKDINSFMSQPSVSRCVHEIVEALNHPSVVKKYIRFPQNSAERLKLKERFFQKYKIPGVIGCIDGTYVTMVRPKENEERYYCRKGNHARNIQLITDADLNILNVDATYGGATHDSFIFNNSSIREHLEDVVNTGETVYLLGDSAYAQRTYLMVPVPNAVEGTPAALYNKIHATARNTVERAIGRLKGRFRCLLVHRVLHYDPDTVAKIVVACCVLHNICNRAGLPAPALDAFDVQEETRFNTAACVRHSVNDVSSTEAAVGQSSRQDLINMLWRAQNIGHLN